MKRLSPIVFSLLICVSLASCLQSDPVKPGETLILKTDRPISYMEHWHGDSGVLKRFGIDAEIGALLQFDFKHRRQFVIFDGSGKQFVVDRDGRISGPFDVQKLFEVTDIWGTGNDDSAHKFALKLENEGVDAAIFVKIPNDNVVSFTFSTKLGNVYNLWLHSSQSQWEERDRDYGIVSHSSITGGLEAMFAVEPSGAPNTFYEHAYLIDHTGQNIENGDSGALGKVTDFFQELPSQSIEAACYFIDQQKYPTHILVLGEHDAVSNGQFLQVITQIDSSLIEKRLIDLRKEY